MTQDRPAADAAVADATPKRITTRSSTRPSAGSAEELLDAGAHSELDAMRHSTAHVMAEAVLELFPGAKLGIGPAIQDGFYYDFELPRPLTPDDLAAIEARMAASVAADHPFVRSELPPAEGRAFFVERDQPYKVEILDDLAAKSKACRRADRRSTSTYEHGAVHRPVQGPARRLDRQDRPVQAAQRGRRLLARRRAAADAPADLRHGLGEPGRPRPIPLAARGGEEARPSPARASSSTCSASTTSRRARPSGIPRAS